jgi:hypothetical protein
MGQSRYPVGTMEDTELHFASPEVEANPAKKWIIAAIVMVAIGLAVFLLNPRKTAEITVQKIDFYAPPPVAGTPDPVIYPGTTKPAEDDLYAVVTVSITDKLHLPIFPTYSSATYTAPDGSSVEGQFVPKEDLPRLLLEYPDLTSKVSDPAATPIGGSETIAPGATRVGIFVVAFQNVSVAKWQAKKSATLTVNLSQQKPIMVDLP